MAWLSEYDKYSAVSGVIVENVTAGALAYRDSNGKLGLADADAAGKKRVCGVFPYDYSAGDNGVAYKRCRIAGLSSKTAGAQQYLSATPGALTETIPSAGAQCVAVGHAISATEVDIEISYQALAVQAAATSTANVA